MIAADGYAAPAAVDSSSPAEAHPSPLKYSTSAQPVAPLTACSAPTPAGVEPCRPCERHFGPGTLASQVPPPVASAQWPTTAVAPARAIEPGRPLEDSLGAVAPASSLHSLLAFPPAVVNPNYCHGPLSKAPLRDECVSRTPHPSAAGVSGRDVHGNLTWRPVDGAHPSQAVGSRPPRGALQLFSGPSGRPDGLAAHLAGSGITCDEVDLVISGSHDMADALYVDGLLAGLSAYVAVVMGPPCRTFSRARVVGSSGPRPLRGLTGSGR